MITVRKLARLSEDTRRRKLVRLLTILERLLNAPGDPTAAHGGGALDTGNRGAPARPPAVDARYWRDLLGLIAEDAGLPNSLRATAERSAGLLSVQPGDESAQSGHAVVARAVNDLRHGLQSVTGGESADWDLQGPAGFATSPHPSGPHPPGENALSGAALYLERIRSPFNLGAIARSAASFGLTEIVLSRETAAVEHPRARRAAMGTLAMLSIRVAELDAVGDARPLFALETGGTPIERFRFPADGIALVGSEELGLSPSALECADSSAGRVSIPAPGPKGSLNVAVAVGILLSWWQHALRGEQRGSPRSGRAER